jgi:hypothetical protein
MTSNERGLKMRITNMPFIGRLFEYIRTRSKRGEYSFTNSTDYWKDRYQFGGNSGCGSYNKLAEFKASVLNAFVQENNITTVIEYGCGDGNQLLLADYPKYIGFDVSEKAISICQDLFRNDKSKKFALVPVNPTEKAQLTLSLDVIFHLIENDVFDMYMYQLFDSSEEFVVIYSSNTNLAISDSAAHVKHRKFSDWIILNRPEWSLIRHSPNEYPYSGDDSEGSFADFYIYKRG